MASSSTPLSQTSPSSMPNSDISPIHFRYTTPIGSLGNTSPSTTLNSLSSHTSHRAHHGSMRSMNSSFHLAKSPHREQLSASGTAPESDYNILLSPQYTPLYADWAEQTRQVEALKLHNHYLLSHNRYLLSQNRYLLCETNYLRKTIFDLMSEYQLKIESMTTTIQSLLYEKNERIAYTHSLELEVVALRRHIATLERNIATLERNIAAAKPIQPSHHRPNQRS
jgi:hypothetical protein